MIMNQMEVGGGYINMEDKSIQRVSEYNDMRVDGVAATKEVDTMSGASDEKMLRYTRYSTDTKNSKY